MSEALHNFVTNTFKNEDEIGFSTSIDASRLASVMQQDEEAVVGDPSPDHFIKFPVCPNDESGQKNMADFVKDQMDNLTRPKVTKELASEVKLATMSFQWTPNNKSPYLQIAAYPQSKNKPSEFNNNVTKGCIKGVEVLQKDGWKISYLGNANDGVSCDFALMKTNLFLFLEVRNHTQHTQIQTTMSRTLSTNLLKKYRRSS